MLFRNRGTALYKHLVVITLIMAILACNIPTDLAEEAVEGLALLELFITPAGDDANDCQTPETACRTIVRGVRVANGMSNAILNLAAGTYDENDQAFIQHPMTLRGTGDAVIRHAAPYNNLDVFIVQVADGETVRMEQFSIEGGSIGIRLANGRLLADGVNFNQLATRAIQAAEGSGPISLQNSRITNTESNAIVINPNVNFTLRNGSISGSMGTPILNYGGTLTLEGVSIFDNVSAPSYPTAILNLAESAGLTGGILRISNSAIHNNRHNGDAMQEAIRHGGEVLEISNSTISSNSGGGLSSGGTNNQTILTHVTIASNAGIGLLASPDNRTRVRLVNSLIVYNGRDCDLRTRYTDASSLPAESINNIDSDNTCRETQSAERAAWDFNPGVDGVLNDNGGNTPTHALLRESPAVDAVDCLIGSDQRGVARPQGLRCDIGAFELEAELGAPPAAPSQTPLAILQETTPGATLPVLPSQISSTATPGEFVRFITGANCRSGPGTVYTIITALQEDSEVPAEGRNSDNTWWYVLVNAGTHCWVAASVVETFGPVTSLPVIPAPPTPIPSSTPTAVAVEIPTLAPVQVPGAPAQLYIENRVCNGQTYTVSLRWLDQSNNEQGFRVYRDGARISTLGDNETKFTDGPAFGGPYTYAVEAFNSGGASGRQTVIENGCIP